jgi:hypothetical protein
LGYYLKNELFFKPIFNLLKSAKEDIDISDKLIKTEIGMPWFRIAECGYSGLEESKGLQGSKKSKKRGNLKSIEMEIESFKELTPKGYYFLGVLPWKLFHSSYLPIERRYGFLKEILPLIDKVQGFVNSSSDSSSDSSSTAF